jgi:quinol monooxygenase YgiN
MIVVARIKAKSGEESKMADALQAMVSKVEKEEGTLIYTLHQSTPYFKELFGKLQPLLEGAPEIEMYDEIAGLHK